MTLAMNINRPLDDEARWQIVLDRDRRFDGDFVMGVHSTGIYCRPSCPARQPKRENVSFYASNEEAEAAGLSIDIAEGAAPDAHGPASALAMIEGAGCIRTSTACGRSSRGSR